KIDTSDTTHSVMDMNAITPAYFTYLRLVFLGRSRIRGHIAICTSSDRHGFWPGGAEPPGDQDLRDHHRREHGGDHADGQRPGEPAHRARSELEQDERRQNGREVRVDDRDHGAVEARVD